MPLTLEEGLKLVGMLATGLSEAVSETSDGGKTITVTEIFALFQTVGIEVIKDIQD
jgi:hypothetical protein